MTEPLVQPQPSPSPATLSHHRKARVVLALTMVAFGAWIVHGFIPALVWAAVLAIAISPLYARAERRWPHLRGGISLPSLFTGIVALVVILPVALGLFRAIAEAQDLMQWFNQVRATGIAVPHWLTQLPFGRDAAVTWWQEHLSTPEATQAQLARFDNQRLLYHTQNIGKMLVHASVIYFFTMLALFFTLRDHESLIEQMRAASSRLFGPSGERIGRQVVQSVRGTIDGLVLVGLGEGAVMTVAYVLLGVPHPVLLGMATAVAAMIPFGAAVTFAIAAFMLLTQDALGSAIAVVVIGFAVVGIADHFIRPVLIGGATRLPFVWVLIGILGGVETLGLLGLFVGPATMAVLIMLWREFVENRGVAVVEAGA
jgi:predicted PurR-regulated permease PerM